LLSDGTWDYVYTGGATPTEQIATSGSSPTTDLLLSDESGNVRGLVQLSSGTHQDQLVNYTDYDAYGNPITESGGSAETGGLTTPQTGISSNYVGSTPWGFGEGYTDPTGLIYLVNRYYDPATGQFLSVDPDLTETGQPYEYAADAPTDAIDPYGDEIPNPYGCVAKIDNAHFEGGEASSEAVKVNGAIIDCSQEPEAGVIDIQLWKTGAHWWDGPWEQAVDNCNSADPGKRQDCDWFENSKYRWQLWNNNTIKPGKTQPGTNTTFYGEDFSGVEIAGEWYWSPGWGSSPSTWTATNFWTNNSVTTSN
jgi:RHS repeat-associated protein